MQDIKWLWRGRYNTRTYFRQWFWCPYFRSWNFSPCMWHWERRGRQVREKQTTHHGPTACSLNPLCL